MADVAALRLQVAELARVNAVSDADLAVWWSSPSAYLPHNATPWQQALANPTGVLLAATNTFGNLW